MASSTPSAPINSSRGAADTTAGRIYFSTPSAQVRVPVADLVTPPPPPPTSAHTILLGGKLSGGVKTIRRRNNYPGRAQVPKNSKKNPKFVAQCRKYPIPYLYTLSRTIRYLYTLNRTIPYLYTLNRTIPYLNTLSRTIPCLNTLRKNPSLAQNQNLVGSQSESSTKKPRQPIRIEYHSAEKNPNALGYGGGPFSARYSLS